MTVPFARAALPRRTRAARRSCARAEGAGTLRDALGPVSIHPELRRQNTAVPGTVEQGKSSYPRRDRRRGPATRALRGDRARPQGRRRRRGRQPRARPQRTCTLLDFAGPTCGFNPLAVDAPADVIADYVVAALKNLFTDADIRASSDRYLRNAIIAVLAYDRRATLWDAARLLSVGEEGYAYRAQRSARACARCPSSRRSREFFTAELDGTAGRRAQHDDGEARRARQQARAAAELAVDQARAAQRLAAGRLRPRDRRRARCSSCKGALGVMGAGNTSVLMQLLVGMLDAALARQQDLVAAGAARGRRAEGRRGAAGPQPRLRRDDGAEALGGPRDGRLLADRRAVGRPRGARPARRAVRPPRVLRDGLGARRAGRGGADDGGVLRQRAARRRPALRARPPGRASAPAQAPRDRQLDHARGTAGAVHRADDPAARRPGADRAARAPVSRARRTPAHRPAPAALGPTATGASSPRERRSPLARPRRPPAHPDGGGARPAHRSPPRTPRTLRRHPRAARDPRRATGSWSSSTARRACAGRARGRRPRSCEPDAAGPRDAGARRPSSGTCSAARSTAASTPSGQPRPRSAGSSASRTRAAGAPAVPSPRRRRDARCAARSPPPALRRRSARHEAAPAPDCGTLRTARMRLDRRRRASSGCARPAATSTWPAGRSRWSGAWAARCPIARPARGRRSRRPRHCGRRAHARTRRRGSAAARRAGSARLPPHHADGCRGPEVERFETVRPDGDRADAARVDCCSSSTTACRPGARPDGSSATTTSWPAGRCTHGRYGRRAEATRRGRLRVPRPATRARELRAGAADRVLCACRAYAGEYPLDWEYPGRDACCCSWPSATSTRVGSLAYGVPACRRPCVWGPLTAIPGRARRALRRSSYRARRDRATRPRRHGPGERLAL